MAQKQRSDDRQTTRLIDKCLVLVFKEKKSRKHEESNSKLGALNGGSLFEDFVAENRECYWNPHLQESINNIRCLGFIQVRPRCSYLDDQGI